MESDGDQKHAAAEETPADAQENAPAAGSRLRLGLKRFLGVLGRPWQRPKRFLQVGVVKIIDALSHLLQRLRKRTAEPGDGAAPPDERGEEREEKQAKAKAHEEPGKEATPEAAPAPGPKGRIHSILIYLLALMIGSVAGMTFSYVLFSTMVSNQAKKIDDQRDEISQLEKQHSRLRESEEYARKESEEYRQRLRELEAQEAARSAEKETAPQMLGGDSPAASRSQQSAPKKTGNCRLDAGNIDNNLTRCLDEFNRK